MKAATKKPKPEPKAAAEPRQSDPPPPKKDDEPLCTICGLRSCYKA